MSNDCLNLLEIEAALDRLEYLLRGTSPLDSLEREAAARAIETDPAARFIARGRLLTRTRQPVRNGPITANESLRLIVARARAVCPTALP
jgi:hypothetical protein